jgi:hypothetical protein
VVVVDETTGLGVVVVCSVVVVRVTGGDEEQAVSTAQPATRAAPRARLKLNVVLIIGLPPENSKCAILLAGLLGADRTNG